MSLSFQPGPYASGGVNKIDSKLDSAPQELFPGVPGLVRPKVSGLARQAHRAVAKPADFRAVVKAKSLRGHRKTLLHLNFTIA